MNTATTQAPNAVLPDEDVHYPSGDGQPMAETGIHVNAIILLYQALQDFFADRDDVLIAADLYWYWEEGNPKARCAPDVMVVPGVGNKPRRSFFTWREKGAVPAAVFEFASAGTWREDLEDKYELYESLGVNEYFVFDPEGAYVRPALRGFRLQDGVYRPISVGGAVELKSDLGFRVREESMALRLFDARTGAPIFTRAEQSEKARQMTDLFSLRAELEKQRAELHEERLAFEKHRADFEKRMADRLAEEQTRRGKALGPGGTEPSP